MKLERPATATAVGGPADGMVWKTALSVMFHDSRTGSAMEGAFQIVRHRYDLHVHIEKNKRGRVVDVWYQWDWTGPAAEARIGPLL